MTNQNLGVCDVLPIVVLIQEFILGEGLLR